MHLSCEHVIPCTSPPRKTPGVVQGECTVPDTLFKGRSPLSPISPPRCGRPQVPAPKGQKRVEAREPGRGDAVLEALCLPCTPPAPLLHPSTWARPGPS